MKNSLLLIILSSLPLFSCSSSGSGHSDIILPSNPDTSIVSGSPIYLADPTIFHDVDSSTYYLYGTSSDEGFITYKSKDLKVWKGPCGQIDGGYVLTKNTSFGVSCFWAPQVFKFRSKYYIVYCAARDLSTASQQIAIAESDSPEGPFSQVNKTCIPANCQEIDPFVFFDDNGKTYLYYVKEIDRNAIYVSQMNDSMDSLDEKTTTLCIKSASSGWENVKGNSWSVAEGPTVIKKDGVYFLFYSANDYTYPEYAVGYAKSKSPFGPWTKCSKPILDHTILHVNGTGHGDVFTDTDGNLWYVFHTHHSSQQVNPRRTAIIRLQYLNGEFSVLPETFRYLYGK
ncbi:glycoside hydrolase family 43 protein [Prevotella cerevisiae]|uniref:Glycoside hydrolase family 43 protein n=1 Tax=Segatella cerevisiae TaxID=2053716 RepID=A0ABT1BZJ1_9BACT|nr:glycoside hydrolase family 43 protein [Segatella cerevisiae]MCO6026501.1 glycoside hydrolase family 43 protein [Segatella cerevisiae]